jgi:hypothetical protein
MMLTAADLQIILISSIIINQKPGKNLASCREEFI